MASDDRAPDEPPLADAANGPAADSNDGARSSARPTDLRVRLLHDCFATPRSPARDDAAARRPGGGPRLDATAVRVADDLGRPAGDHAPLATPGLTAHRSGNGVDGHSVNRALSSAGPVQRAISVGAWRSLAARIVRDDEVGGSNPLAPTSTTRRTRQRVCVEARRPAPRLGSAPPGRQVMARSGPDPVPTKFSETRLR